MLVNRFAGSSGGVAVAFIHGEFKRNKGDIMKKLLTLMLMLSSLAFVPVAKAENVTTSKAFNTPQVRIQIGRRRHRRDWNRGWAYGDRIGYGRTFTRDVRIGFRTYRETYQRVNGRTFLISRVRLY